MSGNKGGSYILVLVVLTTYFTSSFSNIVFECPPDWVQVGAKCYRLFQHAVEFQDAKHACQLYGSNLVPVWGYNENQAVAQLAKNADSSLKAFWIDERDKSGYDVREKGYWGSFEPPENATGECVKIMHEEADYYKSSWYFEHCQEKLPFMCQARACLQGQFRCSNGRCISDTRCDKVDDCQDMSDEANCSSECKHVQTGASGSISHSYTASESCQWVLQSDAGTRIKLTFSSFATEAQLDELQIWVGGPSLCSSRLHHRLSGSGSSVNMGPYYSDNNFMILVFHSDKDKQLAGFQATWTTETLDVDQELIASTMPAVLSSFMFGDLQISQSRNHWVIRAPSSASVITLEKVQVDLAEGAYVTVQDGGDVSSPELARYTGKDGPDHVTSTGNRMRVYLHTQVDQGGDGFNFTYRLGCDVTVKASSGYIMSPGRSIGAHYPGSQVCTWRITAPTPQHMTLKFEGVFEFRQNEDNLTVYDGVDASGNLEFSSSTDNADTAVITSSNGTLFVQMITNAIRNLKGFKASFSVDCPDPMFNSDTQVEPSTLLTLGASITVTCMDGYYFAQEEHINKSSVNMTCGLEGWNVRRTPQCERVYCGAIQYPDNAYVSYYTGAQYGDVVTFECYGGFALIGSQNVTCQQNGSWSSIPECQSSACQVLSPFLNGNRSSNSTSYGTVVRYTCDPGYEIADVASIYCMENGIWSDSEPTCTKLPCLVPSIEHGATDATGLVYFMDSVTVTCDPGFNGSTSMTCQFDQQFDSVPTCKDVDECKSGPCEFNCTNTIGNYTCSCDAGYEVDPLDRTKCVDINECMVNNGSCMDTCNNFDGGYNCSCQQPGMVLYTQNGTSGFFIPEGETGLKSGDVYHIDHTCVAKMCAVTPVLVNGTVLTQKTSFHYEDEVHFYCDLGFEINGSSSATCQADGTWTALPTCQVATCDEIDLTSLSSPYKPTISPSGPVTWGSKVNFTCTENVNGTITFSRECVYDKNTDSYRILPDAIACPVVDCGPLSSLTSLGGGDFNPSTPNHTFLGSSVEFFCPNTFALLGESGLGNTTVTCGADGHWDLGTLRCKGPSCPNPGRPGDAEMYFLGEETLSVDDGIIAYNCSRPGYLLDKPYPRKCVLVGNQTNWNDTVPSCIDMEDPVLHGCPADMIVNRLDAPGFTLPNVTDNSNAIKNFTIDPPTFSPDKPLTTSVLVTFTAEDYAGNMASCQVNLTIRDESVPNITCSDAYTEYIQTESGTVLGFNGKATGLDNQGPVTVTYEPASLTVGKDDIGKSFAVLAVAVDMHGNNKTCQFMVTVEADKCMDFSLPAPQNGVKNCIAQGTGYQCNMTCNSGYYFYDDTPGQYNNSETSTTQVYEYTCTNGTDWSPMADVPDCIEATQAAYVQENGLQYDPATLPVNLTECEAVYKQALVSVGPSVATSFQTTCRALLTLQTIEVTFRNDFVTLSSSGNQVLVNFGLEYGPVSLAEADKERCATLIAALIGTSTVQVDKLVTLSGDNSSCPDMSMKQGSQYKTSSQAFKCTVDDTEKLVTVNGEHICLKSPPGTSKLSGQDPVECEKNTYQNETGASTCTPCPDGKLTESTGARGLDECKLTCKAAFGMVSATGLPPCMECPMNYYAYNATYCQECPAGMATMQPGATNESQCLGACPAGSYSRTGFLPCQPCPVNFYQPDIAQTFCVECAATETTLSDGSISSANCTDANAVKCTPNPCIKGTCLIQDHDYYCQCQTGYTGKNCETMIDMCQSEPCYYGGMCTPIVNGYNCSCPTNYTGDNCENEPDDCAFNDCSSDSVCLDLIGDFKCLCPSGYSGDKCDQKTSVCQGDPCNNGTCVPSEPVRYKCICDAGYTGRVCDSLTEKCTSNPCLYGGQCVNLVDDYRCDCPLGFSGKNCDIRPDFCGSTPCGASGECVNDYITNNALCVCNPGYTAGLQNITWIQNITDMSVGMCDLVDNCSPDPCGNGTCSSHTGSYSCACTSGFEGSMCQHNVDDCAADPCLNGGICKDLTNSYECTCLPGFTGGTCDQNIDECQATPCNATGTNSSVHNAGCEDLINDYQCHCKPGYTGKDCQVDTDECASSPCLHNSTCIDEVNSYTCNCTAGWMGSRCEELVEKCDQNPCQNAADCHNVFNDYFCRCPAQTYGKQCESRTSFCTDSDPCIKPGGQCQESQGNTSCSCSFGYSGLGCEVSVDYCSMPDICSGEGKCRSTFNNFSCYCDKDYSGDRCEVHDDDCAASPCPADVSTCIDLDNSYHCLCNVNKTGEMCDKEVDTNYNLTFHSCNGVSSARLRFPFRMTGSALTVGLWLQLSTANGVGNIFTLYGQKEWSRTGDREEIIRLNTTHVTVNIGGNLEYVAFSQFPIDDGLWQYVSISWTGSDLRVFKNPSNVVTIHNYAVGSSLMPYGWVTLGSDWDSVSGQPVEGSSFEGYISQLNIWNEGFSLDDHAAARRGNFPYDSLLQRWSGYLLDRGVQITANTIQVATVNTTDKVAPTITCPQPDMYLTDQRRTAKWWADPVVTNSDGNSFTTTHSHVTAYTWGKHEVSYAVTNNAGYRAACSFDIVIRRQNCSNPSEYRTPQNGAETCSSDRWPFRNCYVTCGSGYSPPMPIPNFYTCGPEGSFNVFNKFLPFQYLHCGRIFPPKRGLVITAKYTLQGAHDQEGIKTLILKRIKNHVNALWNICKTSECTETVSMSISASARRRRATTNDTVYKLTVNMQDLNKTLTKGSDSLTPEEVMRMFVFDQDILDLRTPNKHLAVLDPSSITINTQLNCDPGQGIVGNICVKCSPGTYAHNSSNTCKECPLGTYQDAEGQFSCTDCESDKTTELPGADNNTMCLKSCDLGEMYNKTLGDCMKCPKGYYQDETGQFYCKPCSPLNTTADEGSKSSSDCISRCNEPGTELSANGTCVDCGRGRYRNPAYHDKCQPCSNGRLTNSSRAVDESECVIPNCQHGQFINSSLECENCDYGSYQPEYEKYLCMRCPNGTTTDFKGASNVTDCGFYCPEGQEEDPAAPYTCRLCAVTGFKNNSLPFRTCQACPNNMVSEFPGATHEDNCTLWKCMKGEQTFSNNSGCMDCPLGTYQPENFMKECLPCPGNTSTRNVGAQNLTQCEEYCPDGQEKVSGDCQPCRRGYYKNNSDGIYNMCELCPEVNITAGTGAKSLGECVIANCSAGYKLTADNSSCVPCGFGFYQPDKWKSECIECPQNMNTSADSSMSPDDCQFYCPPGSESRRNLGSSSSNGSCVPCEIGTFKDMAGFLPCTKCFGGNITEVTGANSSSLCNLENCTAGSYLGADRVCHPCPRGQYQPLAQQKACEYCPQGSNGRNMTTPAEGADSHTDCILDCDSGEEYNSKTMQCDPCPIGYFRERGVNETCVPCPPDRLTPTVGSVGETDCSVVKCLPGTEVDTNGQCKDCPIGSYQPDQHLHNQTCIQCPPGTTTMQEATANLSQCLKDCGDGKQLSSTVCVDCPIGYYKTASQSFYCQLCSNGKITKGTGSTTSASCTVANCTDGQYRDLNNQCQSCPDGTYQDKKWQTNCIRCPGIYEPVDYTTNGTGATNNDQCSVANTCKNQMNSCSSEQTCQYDNSTKTVSCLCRIGYNTVGSQCVHICSQGYCMNGATCNKVSIGVGATCKCSPMWTGEKCETRADPTSMTPYIIGGSVGGIFGLLILILIIVWCCWCTRRTPGTPRPVVGGPAVHAINPTYEPIKGLRKPNQPYTGGLADSLGRTMPSMAQNGTMDQKSVAGYSHAPSKFLFYEDKDDPVRIAPHYTPSVAYSHFGGPGVYEEKTSVMDFVDEEEAILPGNTGTGIYATVEK